jgi:hypothetical protein
MSVKLSRAAKPVPGLAIFIFSLYAGINLLWGAGDVVLENSKLDMVERTSLEDFRSKHRKKICSDEFCFNTYTLQNTSHGKYIFGMSTPPNFGRIGQSQESLELASAYGTRFDIVLVKDHSQSCKDIADHLDKATLDRWELNSFAKGIQNDQIAYYEQRIFSEHRRAFKEPIKVILHCQKYADATLSIVAWVHPEDKRLTPSVVSDLLKDTVRLALESK